MNFANFLRATFFTEHIRQTTSAFIVNSSEYFSYPVIKDNSYFVVQVFIKLKAWLNFDLILFFVLFASETEFPMLVPRLPQNILDLNIECASKPKQLYSLYDQRLGALMFLFYCSDINLCF